MFLSAFRLAAQFLRSIHWALLSIGIVWTFPTGAEKFYLKILFPSQKYIWSQSGCRFPLQENGIISNLHHAHGIHKSSVLDLEFSLDDLYTRENKMNASVMRSENKTDAHPNIRKRFGIEELRRRTSMIIFMGFADNYDLM